MKKKQIPSKKSNVLILLLLVVLLLLGGVSYWQVILKDNNNAQSITPTKETAEPTTTQNYKVTYKYYIEVDKDAPKRNGLVVKESDNEKSFSVQPNTKIFIHCDNCTNGYQVQVDPSKEILEFPKKEKGKLPVSLGMNILTFLEAKAEGAAIIYLMRN